MPKLTKLNKKQVELLDEVKNEWINLILDSGKDLKLEDIEEDVETIYKKCKLKKPLILIADSWLAQQYMIAVIIGNANQVWNQIESQVRSKVESQIESQVRSQVRSQIESKVWSQVESQIRSQVGSQIESQVRSQIESQELYFANQYFGLGESTYFSFYDYFKRIGVVKDKDFDFYLSFYKKGIWNVVFFENFVFVCKLPLKILKDNQGNLHSTEEASVQWRDKVNNYFLHGVGFDEKLWKKIVEDKLDCKEILKLKNIEQRYVALKFKGAKKLIEELQAKLIDSSDRGNELYALNEVIRNRTLKLLKYQCPSTGRIYVKFVPDKFIDADKAQSWSFQIKPIEYKQIIKET